MTGYRHRLEDRVRDYGPDDDEGEQDGEEFVFFTHG
mgnify:CR=1 FL=1